MTGSPVTGIPPKTGNLYINPARHKAKKNGFAENNPQKPYCNLANKI